MQNAVTSEYLNYIQQDLEYYYDAEVIDLKPSPAGEPIPLDFVNEIDAWARHALARNGFSDF